MDRNVLGRFVIVIPSLNPDEKLIDTIKSLKAVGFDNYIIVNDGSDYLYEHFFRRFGCYRER